VPIGLGEDVDRSPDVPRAAASSSAGQSTTAARETSTTTEPGAIASKHSWPIEPTFSVVTGRG
jgi:hypothetical protein